RLRIDPLSFPVADHSERAAVIGLPASRRYPKQKLSPFRLRSPVPRRSAPLIPRLHPDERSTPHTICLEWEELTNHTALCFLDGAEHVEHYMQPSGKTVYHVYA